MAGASAGTAASPLAHSNAARIAEIDARLDRALTGAERLTAIAWDMGPKLLGALLILMLAWVIAKQARRSLYRAFDRPQVDQTLLRFGANAARWIVLVVALVAALGVLGFPPASVVTVMGAAGLAVGLALQGSLANLAAGIMLLVLRPFRVGDTITVAGVTGKVDDIELFQTKLDTPDNRRIIMPNSQVFGSTIDNQTHHPRRAVTVPVIVDAGADPDATRDALERAARSVPQRFAEPGPGVVLDAITPAGVQWNVTIWTATPDFGAAKQALLRAIRLALGEAGIPGPITHTVMSQREWVPPQPLAPGQPSAVRETPAIH